MRRLQNVLIPLPKKIEQTDNSFLVGGYESRVKFVFKYESELVEETRNRIIKRLADMACIGVSDDADYVINVSVDPTLDMDTDEGYTVKTYEGGADLIGKGAAGAFYAAVTFADMLECDNSTVYVPEAYIFDFPDFPERSEMMECRWGSQFMEKEDFFKAIDYFASTKHNRVLIEIYSCWGPQFDEDQAGGLFVEIPGYPEAKKLHNKKYYSVRENKWVRETGIVAPMVKEDFLGEVIAYGKRKHVKVLVGFNSLGHNTIIPTLIPEISAKNPDGTPKHKCFCTHNPKTIEVVYATFDNIIDKYCKPYGITEICVGLDEVADAHICECPECSKYTKEELFFDYMEDLVVHLKDKGMDTVRVSWDMLNIYNRLTPEYRAHLEKKGIADVMMVNWWSYMDPPQIFRGHPEVVNSVFRGLMKPYSGYMNWDITSDCQLNIRACMKLAKEYNFECIEPYGMFDIAFDKNFATIADLAWNVAEADNKEAFDLRYAERYYPNDRTRAMEALDNMFEVMRDETINNYMNRAMRWMTYYMYCYRSIHNEDLMKGITTFKFKNFPGEAFDRLNRSDRIDFDYLKRHHRMAKEALDFFENSGRHDEFNDAWILNAKHYYVLADEYIGLWGRYREYNDGIIDVYEVIREFERVLKQREELMALIEMTKFRPNSYTMLRQQSVFRQYFIDVIKYLKSECAKGNARPKLDMTDINDIVSPMFKSLR